MKEVDDTTSMIRAATPEDAASLATLARQLLDYERALNEHAGELMPWAATTEEVRKQIGQAGTRFFIAARGGEILGYVKAVVYAPQLKRSQVGNARWLKDAVERRARRAFDFIMRRPRPNVQISAGYIAGAFVRRDVRRAQIGRALVALAEDWFRDQGIETSNLHVLYANESARRFWEALGYQPSAMEMRKRL